MKQGKIVVAYKIIEEISSCALSLPVALRLFKLKQALEPQWLFQLEEERKLIDECNPTINGGVASFSDAETGKRFNDKLRELSDMDIEISYTPVSIPVTENVKISVSDLTKLADFIKIEGEEE